jgi:hypothetical protein
MLSKPVRGWPHYSIFYDGRVYSFKTKRFLRPFKSNVSVGFYLQIKLHHNGKSKTFLLHRLIAMHFIPNENNYREINHKNGIKTDNRLSNLEWCTSQYNKIHAYNEGLNKSKKGKDHNNYGKTGVLSNNKIMVYDYETGIFYDTIREAAFAKGVGGKHLSRMLKGDRKNFTSIRYTT